MSKLFNTRSHQVLNDLWLLVFRVSAGAFMITHGLPKLNRLFSGGSADFPDPLGVGGLFSNILAVSGEVLFPAMIILGLLTRLSAIPVIITMAVAAFVVHGNDPFQRKEMALLYLVVFTTILVFGAGKYSFDNFLGKKRR
ncbi:uncharacterized membrane protein YphA, DoxX/SURF4 family [Bacteroidales bacterium 6E]|nr:uncharacterized membrane protein YphA, DoxX/SURF4 family [Bacteroidales bacterium 6E]